VSCQPHALWSSSESSAGSPRSACVRPRSCAVKPAKNTSEASGSNSGTAAASPCAEQISRASLVKYAAIVMGTAAAGRAIVMESKYDGWYAATQPQTTESMRLVKRSCWGVSYAEIVGTRDTSIVIQTWRSLKGGKSGINVKFGNTNSDWFAAVTHGLPPCPTPLRRIDGRRSPTSLAS